MTNVLPAAVTTVPVAQAVPTTMLVGAVFATYHWMPSVSPFGSTSANV